MTTEECASSAMQIFVSYGHPEQELCAEIVAALRARGYDPWYDEEQIHHGNDWREKIIRGLKSSHAVVSCLSEHSVRNPGVCLDELSIAIGVKGGNIRTILLESEAKVRPPASVCHLQWLDMSRWREIKAQGADIFNPWFSRKMDELAGILESDETCAFAGEIEAIRKQLHINYSTSKQRRLLRDHIVGREWLIREVEEWLDDPDGERMCVLYGEPGVGKSAFAAKYIHYNPRVAAGLFCEYDRPHYNDPKIVAMTLAFLMACRLPHYRAVLADILEQEKRLGELNAAELFDLLLTNPLSGMNIDGGQETLCIVIDGLDECAQGEQNALADTLFLNVPRLPKWLRVLVTSREVSAVTAPLAGAFRMELRAKQEQNLEDVRAYYKEQLEERFGQETGWESALETLTERSGGIFQYAVLVADGILRGKMKITEADTLPEGLAGVYHRWFGWFFPDQAEYDRVFRPALGMMLAAPEPLPSEELCRVLDWDEDELGVFIRRIGVLLQRDENIFKKETISFSHEYLSQWLGMDAAKNPYACSRKAGERRMARGFYALFQKNAKKLTEFEVLHLAELLTSCGEEEMAEEAELNYDLSLRIVDAGNYCDTWGALSMALKCFCQAQNMAEKMVGKQDTPENRNALGNSYNDVADILMQKGDLDGALELFQKSLDIQEQLVQEQNTPQNRRKLCACYNYIAEILREKGDLDGALELFQKSLDIQGQLVQEQNTPQNRLELCVYYSNIAETLRERDDLNGALKLFQKSLDIREQLAQEQNTLENRQHLGDAYNNFASILRQKGDLDGALDFHRRALDIQEQLAQEQDTPRALKDLARSYDNVAVILANLGDLDEAVKLSRRSLDIFEQVAREHNTPWTQFELSVTYTNTGCILGEKGNWDEALELYQKGRIIVEQLVQEQNTLCNRSWLGHSYTKVGYVLTQKGDLDGALELFQKSLDIDEQLTREQNTPENRRNLGISCNNVGAILIRRGDLDEAFWLLRKALKIFEQLVQDFDLPADNEEYQKCKAWCQEFNKRKKAHRIRRTTKR